MERAGKWLALRPRSEAELRDRLLQGGFEPGVVEDTLGRLRELKLVDDFAFAQQWVEERAARKGLGPAKLAAELSAKGIEQAAIEAAIASLADEELTRAKEVAAARIRRLAELPLAVQAARLEGSLARRGFSAEVSEQAVKAVLPPEGWD